MIRPALSGSEPIEEKMAVAKERSTVPFLLEKKIGRKEPKSDFLLKLEKRQEKERLEAERKQIVVHIKGRAKK